MAGAAYGQAQHPDVVWLRAFRDQILQRSGPGRAFIALYWRIGPRLAPTVRRNPRLKALTRRGLSLLVAKGRQRWRDL